jgi:hypothetical protein
MPSILIEARYRMEEELDRADPRNDSRLKTVVMSKGALVTYFPDIAQAVVDEQKNGVPQDMPIDLALLHPDQLSEAPSALKAEAPDVLDNGILRYEVHGEESSSARIYVDPRLGHRCRKLEFLDGGVITRTVTADKFEFVNGIPFPTLCHETDYSSDGASKIRDMLIEVESARFNVPVPPSDFRISFAPNTWVTHIRLNLRHLVNPLPEQIDHELDLTPEQIMAQSLKARLDGPKRPQMQVIGPTSAPAAESDANTAAPTSEASWLWMGVRTRLTVAVMLFFLSIAAFVYARRPKGHSR